MNLYLFLYKTLLRKRYLDYLQRADGNEDKLRETLLHKTFYEEYDRFYEDTFLPMKISEEKLLIRPEELEIKDPEDISEEETGPQEEQQEDTKTTQKKKVEDFDFGDDFW